VLTEREQMAVPSSEVRRGGSGSDHYGDKWHRCTRGGSSRHSWLQESEGERKKLRQRQSVPFFPMRRGRQGEDEGGVPARGSGQWPRGATCGTTTELDPVAGTGRGGGKRCRAALIAMPHGGRAAGQGGRVRTRRPLWAGCRGPGLKNSTPFIYSDIFKLT
jgi:hypothetical protein